ncbi:MAG TPA: alpha/beta hydrolase [Anaerolineaceae bacterium]
MFNYHSERISANGIQIHYYRAGLGDKSLVLLHGITDNGLCWIRLAEALAPDYDLIMPDARGHGQSEAPASGYDPQDRAGDVYGLIKALHLENPVLIGHSMGAETAALTAAYFPEAIRAVILEDPPFRSQTSQPTQADREAFAENFRKNIESYGKQTIDEIIANGKAQHPNWDALEFLPWAESKKQANLNLLQIVRSQRASWREVVQAIICPILLFTADPDKGAIITPEVVRELASLWYSGRAVYLEGAGHNIRREQFEPYLENVRWFLEKVFAEEPK